jgi:hypothetical protein
MDSFMSLDVTPARVVALYPENTVSGRLHLPQDRWVKAFGGPENGRLLPASPPEAEDEGTGDKEGKGGLLRQMPHLGLTKRNSMETLKDQDKESVTGVATPSSAESVAEFEGGAKLFCKAIHTVCPDTLSSLQCTRRQRWKLCLITSRTADRNSLELLVTCPPHYRQCRICLL